MHRIEEQLEKTLGKDDLKFRSLPYINKANYAWFRANILTSRVACEWLWLLNEWIIMKAKTAQDEVNERKEDIKNALLAQGNEDWWKNIRSFLNTWIPVHCYKRWESYRANPHIEQKYREIIWSFSLESTLFNKIYEMMCIDLIKAHAQEKNKNHHIEVLKTSTYDDVMCWVDAILIATDKTTNKKKTFFIDMLTSASETSRYTKNKWSVDLLQCYEYNSAIWRWIKVPKEDKIIYPIHPELWFLTLDKYLSTIKEKGSIDPTEVLDIYRKLHSEHAEYTTIDNDKEIPIIWYATKKVA